MSRERDRGQTPHRPRPPRTGTAPLTRPARLRALVPAGLVLVLLLVAGCTVERLPDPQRTDPADPAAGETDDPLAEGLQAHAEERYDDAVTAYERALDEDPDNHLALYNLGQLEQSRGNPAEAEEYYRQALEIEPAYVPALLNLAIIRTAEDDHDEAVDLYTQVTEIDDEHAGAYLLLGYALLAQGDDEEAAEEAFDRAVELDPALEDRLPD